MAIRIRISNILHMNSIHPVRFITFIIAIIHMIQAVAYRGFLAPGARSGISAPFSLFFSHKKKSKMVDPKLISVISKVKSEKKKKSAPFSIFPKV